MQDGIPQAPHWLQLTLGIVAALLGGVGIDRVYSTWLNRRKPASEIHLTEETATEVRVRSSSAAGDAVMRMMDRLDAAQTTIDKLREERDDWQQKYELGEIENRSLLQQMERANAYLKANGLHLSDLDKPRTQQLS